MNPNSFSPITQLVEDTIVDKLTDQQYGLIAVSTQIAADRDIELPDIDLSEEGAQLHRLQISPDDYYSTENPIDPAVFVYVTQSQDNTPGSLKGQDFSGTVVAGIDIFLTDESESLPYYLQKLANIYTDAIYHVFGVAAHTFEGTGINVLGGIKVARTRPQKPKAANWFLALTISLPLHVY